jgi:hypothetical protein
VLAKSTTDRGRNTSDAPTQELWAAVDRLVDGATVSGLLAHKLGALGANRLRRLGLTVPTVLQYEERAASVNMLTAVPLIKRIRASCDGTLVLLKGPEVARLYPSGARRFGDLDILAPEAAETQQALLAAGFVVSPDPDDDAIEGHHHLQPLVWPTIPLRIEVHERPNWPLDVRPAPLREIVDASVPTSFGIDGVRVPRPDHHALLLAAHAWRDVPLDTLRDLVDIAAVAQGLDRAQLQSTAEEWGIGRIWKSTRRTIDALFLGGARTLPLRTWARHLEQVRERTVFETHLERHVSGFSYLPPARALGDAARAVGEDIRPLPGETWGEKLRRMRVAATHARLPMTTRDRGLGQATPLQRDPNDE